MGATSDRQGHGQIEAAQEVFQIGGVLTRGVDANVEVGLGMLLINAADPSAQDLSPIGCSMRRGKSAGGFGAIGSQTAELIAAIQLACVV